MWRKIVPILITIISIIIIVALGEVFHNNLVSNSPCEINFFDNSLFSNNIDVILNKYSISPRIANFYIFYTLMSLGLSYEESYFVIFLTFCFITAFAICSFARQSLDSDVICIVLLATYMLLYSSVGVSSGFRTFIPSALFLGLGSTFFLCALVSLLVFETFHKINISFFFVSLAAMAHVHEGLWALVVITFLSLSKVGLRVFKSYGLYVATVTLLFLTIPNVLSGADSISSEVFYKEYVLFRASSHLLFWNSFPLQTIPSVIEFFIIIYIMKMNGLSKKDIQLAEYGVLLFVGIVMLWYVTCELFCLQFFIKMYIPKCFKNINILFTLLLCKALSKDNVNIMSLLFLMSSVLLPYQYKGFFFYWIPELLLFILINRLPTFSKYKNNIFGGLIVAILSLHLYFHPCAGAVSVLLVVGLIMLYKNLSKYYIMPTVMTIFLLFYCYSIKDSDKSFVESALELKSGKEVYDFGKAVTEFVPPTEMILMDSKDASSGFIQHISRRDAYILYKAVPSNVRGIDIWYHRLKEVEDIEKWDASRYAKFMKSKNINYVVIKTKDYNPSFMPYFEKKHINKEYLLLERKG